MKAILKLGFFLALVLPPKIVSAQYSFTPSIQGAGSANCREAAQEGNKLLQGLQVSGIPTLAECNRIRQYILAINVSVKGCRVYYTCTPCVGTEMTNGVNQDSKSLTQPVLNQGVEIRNSIQDYDYQRQVQDLHNFADALVSNGNADYAKSLLNIIKRDQADNRFSNTSSLMLMRRYIPNVENEINATAELVKGLMDSGYGDPTNLTLFLQDRFKELTGITIGEYANIENPTYEVQETLNCFNEFADAVLAKLEHDYANNPKYEYKALEMSIYALHVYNDENAAGWDNYCPPLRDVNNISTPEERKSAQSILDFLNEKNHSSDFQADFYYDKDTDKYILAFRGTETKMPLEDWLNDGSYLCFGRSAQHDIASELADKIKESGIPIEKLTITGHSLGGGLALLAGLKTGAETYVYDPLHISDICKKHYGLNTDNTAHIHSYEQEKERLVKWGEIISNWVMTGAKNSEISREVMKDVNQPPTPLSIGEQTKVELPSYVPSDNSASSYFNHSQVDMISGLTYANKTKSDNFFTGKNFLLGIKAYRKSKSYEAPTSAIYIDTRGLDIQTY